jgi:hypothetical protein
LLENEPLDDSKHIYRCIVWIKQSNENNRISTLMDIEENIIKSFIRPKEDALHNIIEMLVDQIERVNLDDYFRNIKI